MTVLSRLKPLLIQSIKIPYIRIRKSHARTIEIKPTTISFRYFLNYMHFYFCLFGLPLFATGIYVKLFYDEGELAETPEGYVPEYFEYERNPISRFIAKYIHNDPQIFYENKIASIAKENDKRYLVRVKRDIKYIMSQYNDYQAWYHEVPEDARLERTARYENLNKIHKYPPRQ